MAFNFDSGQFNSESTPKRLGNWQVPRWAPTRARPLEMRPDPKPICDINGHFLPGAPRGTSRCFGHYTGTWELPRKITRKVAEELAKEPPNGRFPDWLNLRVQRPKAAAAARLRAEKRGKLKREPNKLDLHDEDEDAQTFEESKSKADKTRNKAEDNKDQENKDTDKDDDPLELNIKKEPIQSDGRGPYVPGSLTDPDKRHDSHEALVKDAVEQIHGPQEEEVDKFWRKVAENTKKNDLVEEQNNMRDVKTSGTPKLPHVNVAQNFQFARKMHVGNLEHQPLPDTLGYRNLTKVAEHRDSDIIVKPYAIGWKGYGASGPTCCTKMRVHRPKTSDPKKPDGDKGESQRPSTSAPDLGGQYAKQMSLMDLAICWDFRPDDPKREPRPPKHIDGSNGSKAPAVFTMVHTPKEEHEGINIGHTNPIFNQNRVVGDIGHHPVPYFEKDMAKERRRESCDVQYCPQHATANERGSRSASSSRKSSGQSGKKPECDGIHGCGTPSEMSRKSSRGDTRPEKLQPIKDAWNAKNKNNNAGYDVNRNRNSLESYEKTPLAQGKLHHSSPNESQQFSRRSTKDSDQLNIKHKNCVSCNGAKLSHDTKQKEDYKFAFKAGNPNSVQSVTGSTDSKGVKMPKMRHPYSKKSYTIPTLAPPFSIWRDANATGYPEHWRLASVYQHAYKPPEQRRKPLIDSVYQ
ncbi:hypothetical protein B5X24_HaOG206447 [Helicoverpa armigera]|uniref:Cilia- and flagella-associated protein 126 n=1 Tax=Helicoverpa armigera TaxID=29058 RepID=A0A2W1BJU5_HELAM|nr:hypothetical protein B5X24_HaOG206447 [Helicoverpa armigera]